MQDTRVRVRVRVRVGRPAGSSLQESGPSVVQQAKAAQGGRGGGGRGTDRRLTAYQQRPAFAAARKGKSSYWLLARGVVVVVVVVVVAGQGRRTQRKCSRHTTMIGWLLLLCYGWLAGWSPLLAAAAFGDVAVVLHRASEHPQLALVRTDD